MNERSEQGISAAGPGASGKIPGVLVVTGLVVLAGVLIVLKISSRPVTQEDRLRVLIESYFRRIDYPRSEEEKQSVIHKSHDLLQEDRAARALYAAYLDDPKLSDRVRMHCMMALSRTEDRSYFQHIAKFLEHPKRQYRLWAIECLVWFKDRRVVQKVLEISRTLGPTDKTDAAKLLQALGSNEAIPMYIDLLDYLIKGGYPADSPEIQQTVQDLYFMTGQKFGTTPEHWLAWWKDNKTVNRIPLIEVELFESKDIKARLEFIKNLAAIGSEPVISVLRKVVTKDTGLFWNFTGGFQKEDYLCVLEFHAEFSTTAQEALRAIGEVDGERLMIQTLVEILDQYRNPDPVLVETLQFRLAYPPSISLNDPAGMQALVKWWNENHERAKWDYLQRKFVVR